METKIGFYIAGQSVLCLIIGVMALIAYLIIGLPNALVLALVAGVFEAVPMVGPLLGAIPAADHCFDHITLQVDMGNCRHDYHSTA